MKENIEVRNSKVKKPKHCTQKKKIAKLHLDLKSSQSHPDPDKSNNKEYIFCGEIGKTVVGFQCFKV
ncbi:unnamed protein product [Larinioides sclopetarius]|uniref:Uncharacterized protein n=1 Tax=Larinioides sclopetarius TaxID=280406 RepID=A0AAV1ZVY2_9ARAC